MPPKGQMELIPVDADQTKLFAKTTRSELPGTHPAMPVRSILEQFKKCSSTDLKPADKRNAESDVDIILIVKNDAKALKRELRRIGTCWLRRRRSCRRLLRTSKKSGKAGSGAGRRSVKRSNATRCASLKRTHKSRTEGNIRARNS